jgi:hypothetical protein
MRDRWKRFNVLDHAGVFTVFRSAIKHDHFKYSKKRIVKKFDIGGIGSFKLIADWIDEESCGYDMFKKIAKPEKDLKIVEVIKNNP